MKKKLVIFGVGEFAELVHFYFSNFSDYEIISFTVDAPYIPEGSIFIEKPVVPFEEVVNLYPPSEHDMFIAVTYAKLAKIRSEKFLIAKSWGYSLATFVSPKTSIIGNVTIGENCFIFEDNTLQPFTVIGNNVTLWSGNHIGHHSSIGDHSFVTSHVVISGHVKVGERCFIGVNSTFRDHVVIGDNCIFGAGSLILSDVAPDGVYAGKETERSRVPSSRVRTV